jgi:hypothetical protein
MIDKVLAALAAAGCLVVPVLAEDGPPATPRFRFSQVGEQFVRLDRQSGQVSVCSAGSGGWTCDVVPEQRAAIEKEIARLRDENTKLNTDLATCRAQHPGPTKTEPPAAQNGNGTPQQVGSSRLQRVAAAAGKVWRRVIETIARAQKQVLRRV